MRGEGNKDSILLGCWRAAAEGSQCYIFVYCFLFGAAPRSSNGLTVSRALAPPALVDADVMKSTKKEAVAVPDIRAVPAWTHWRQ